MAREKKGGAPAKKSTAVVCNQRSIEVMKYLLEGQSRPDIIEYAKKEWNVSAATVDGVYIPKAKKIIEEYTSKDIEYTFALCMERANKIFNMQLIDNRNPDGALAANAQIWKMTTEMTDRRARTGATMDKDFEIELPNFEEELV